MSDDKEKDNTPKKKPKSFSPISCLATVLTGLYLAFAILNLSMLMYPLSQVKDLHLYKDEQLVGPLWGNSMEVGGGGVGAGSLSMKVYLSSVSRFNLDFMRDEFALHIEDEEERVRVMRKREREKKAVLLWEETEVSSSSLAKSFILTSNECIDTDENVCSATQEGEETDDVSFRYATSWLDDAEKTALERDGGLISAMSSSAGGGIESTSVLLTAYQSGMAALGRIGSTLRGIVDGQKHDEESASKASSTEENAGGVSFAKRSIVRLNPKSPLWSALQNNSTLHVHVVLTRRNARKKTTKQPTTFQEAARSLQDSVRSHSSLLGHVSMIKYDPPHHINPPRRILYHDLIYLLERYVTRTKTEFDFPPWDMSVMKPNEYTVHQTSLQMKKDGVAYPYWKPEVSIKFVSDTVKYPIEYVGMSGMEVVKSSKSSSGYAFLPALHVDEIGLTSEKYVPVNETVGSLPLRITFDRNDVTLETTEEKTNSARTTGGGGGGGGATAGGISPARWRLLSHLSKSLDSQKELGFEQSDIDDLRRLIADTNVTLLGITVLASVLHLLFEFLTFKNDVTFWNKNTDLTGLSVRSLFLDMISQVIILLYLIEMDSSLLMTVPTAIGCLIALWKCQRGAGFRFVKVTKGEEEEEERAVSWWNVVPRMVGYELRATRLEVKKKKNGKEGNDKKDGSTGNNGTSSSTTIDLTALTIETDRIATQTLGSLLLPVVIIYTIYSLVHDEHTGWYSWLITSASSGVYAFGFVLMTPQLFLNYKLKSVAHLPWRVLGYRFLNTFIDDLFAFIIRMPTMARISCFRDDVVFIIYLYQRWLYPVDTSRPVEGGGETAAVTEGQKDKATSGSSLTKKKKSDGKDFNTDKKNK